MPSSSWITSAADGLHADLIKKRNLHAKEGNKDPKGEGVWGENESVVGIQGRRNSKLLHTSQKKHATSP
jgi:hypothetical protein